MESKIVICIIYVSRMCRVNAVDFGVWFLWCARAMLGLQAALAWRTRDEGLKRFHGPKSSLSACLQVRKTLSCVKVYVIFCVFVINVELINYTCV